MENKLIIHSNSPPIFCLRGMNVMLDADLAKLYGVSTTRMNEQVKRNKIRFPDRFCFQMTPNELKNWISQNATSKSQRMGIRKCPWVFTEYGLLDFDCCSFSSHHAVVQKDIFLIPKWQNWSK